MREGLGKIAERFALRAGLLGVESQMIGVAQHAFEQEPGLVEPFGIGLSGAG